MSRSLWVLAALALAAPLRADEAAFVKKALGKTVTGPRQSLLDLQDHLEPRIPKMPAVKTAAEWDKHADRIRSDVLSKIVFRGAAARGWRDAKVKVEYKGKLACEGYTIRKLRYEVLPGMWAPALLYEPDKLKGKVPVALAVNGHDAKGKAAPYKQIRCINLAKRGMVVLNAEWFNMGELRGAGYSHYRMNQLDLCGASGLAPFYLAMTRALDLLLAHPNADPGRVSVSGLSGGGWQTIFVSALDKRVTLANPVAGYSSFTVKIRDHFKDLGDSEQTPCDLATLADYTHLTALRAPRPTLLTYNAKDACCFEAGYALPPLLKTAGPVFKLHGKEKHLRSHVNHDPGTHNYEKDNREQFYRMIGDFFYAGDKAFSAKEVPCDKEVKDADDLLVGLPKGNHDFHTLAAGLAAKLPKAPALPTKAAGAPAWQAARRKELRELVRAKEFTVKAEEAGKASSDDTAVTYWKLRLGGAWTVPVADLNRGGTKGTAILLNDAGRAADPANAERLLKAGYRVLAVDLFYFGESKLQHKDFLFALLLGAVGDRPLGLQASQLAAVARWASKGKPVDVVAVGPRTGLIALVAAGLEEKAIGRLELHGALGSLKEVIEKSRSVDQTPEMFCFGLLEALDVPQMVALVAPRPVALPDAGDRAKKELAGLKAWYKTLGKEFDPLP